MRIVLDILLLAPALIYQSTLAAHAQVRGVGLDLAAVLLASLSILQGWMTGALGGLICGLVLDSVFGQMGYYALRYMLLGLLAGLGAERFRPGSLLMPALTVTAVYAATELIPAVYLFFAGAQVGWMYALFKALMSAAVCGAAFLPVHALMRRLHRWDVISAPIFRFRRRKW